MFEKLRDQLASIFQQVSKKAHFTQDNLKDPLLKIRNALLEADATYPVVQKLLKRIEDRLIGKTIPLQLTASQWLTKIVYEELQTIMGSSNEPLCLKEQPTIILVVGLQGAGKTTLVAKMGHYLQRKGEHPYLIAADLQRAGAVEQLTKLANQISLPYYEATDKEHDPLQLIHHGIAAAKQQKASVIIVDTAGRKSIDVPLMQELQKIEEAVQPTETLLVIDGMIGQSGLTIAQQFSQQIKITGIVLTKMDGNAPGGVAIALSDSLKKPIKFIGHGEKLHQIAPFHPDRMAKRILGMGDILSLVEEAEAAAKAEEKEKIKRKINKNHFDYDLVALQITQLQKMGNIRSLISKLPSTLTKNMHSNIFDSTPLEKLLIMINSMTVWERSNPTIFHNNSSRKLRVAKGAGISMQELQRFIARFEQMKKQFQQMKKEPNRFKQLLPS